MRNMLAFVAALALTFTGVGWYLDWFTFHTTPAPSGRRSVTVDFDTQKISSDVHKAEQEIQHRIAEKAKEQNAIPKPASVPAIPGPSQNLSIPSIHITTDK